MGTLTLQVPQDRDGAFSTQLFARYQRNEKALVLALMEMYVEGVSTRKVREITEVLCGTSFSKSLVSELAGQLDTELAAWHNRPLTDTTYPYLSVDARYEHVRQGGHVVSQGVLIVAGVRADGHREILAVAVADTESEATYQYLFGELKARGLSGVRVVTSDGHTGTEGGHRPAFPGRELATVPSPLYSRSSWHGGRGTTRRTGSRSSRNLRGDDTGAGAGDGGSGGGTVGTDPSGSRTASGRGDRGMSGLPRIPLGASRTDSDDERIGAVA